MSRTTPAMSPGAITNPPTSSAASMKIGQVGEAAVEQEHERDDGGDPDVEALRPAAEQVADVLADPLAVAGGRAPARSATTPTTAVAVPYRILRIGQPPFGVRVLTAATTSGPRGRAAGGSAGRRRRRLAVVAGPDGREHHARARPPAGAASDSEATSDQLVPAAPARRSAPRPGRGTRARPRRRPGRRCRKRATTSLDLARSGAGQRIQRGRRVHRARAGAAANDGRSETTRPPARVAGDRDGRSGSRPPPPRPR